jgi:hypothetical protein
MMNRDSTRKMKNNWQNVWTLATGGKYRRMVTWVDIGVAPQGKL